MFGSTTNHGRIRRSALFMLLALAVEVLSMFWRHPLSFYCFVAAGSVLGILGIVSFLLSFVSPPAEAEGLRPVEVDADERRAA